MNVCLRVKGNETCFHFLRSRIKEEKEKEEPKTIPLRVYGKGLNTYAVVSRRRKKQFCPDVCHLFPFASHS